MATYFKFQGLQVSTVLLLEVALHVPGLSEDLPRLAGALVEAGLESDLRVAHPAHVLLVELAPVLLRHLRAHPRPRVLGVQLRLEEARSRVHQEEVNMQENSLRAWSRDKSWMPAGNHLSPDIP